jgi:hypothetical protein
MKVRKKAFVIVFWNPKRDAPEMCQVRSTRQEAERYLANLVKKESGKQGSALNQDPARGDIKNYFIREFDVEL